MKKITIEQLLAEKNVNIATEMYYDSIVLNSRIDFTRIKPSKVMDIMQEIADETLDVYTASLYLIYLSVPMFRNKELQTKYEIKGNPYEVVEHIFKGDIMDITAFGTTILNMYGFTRQRVQEVKK
jgi:hypothetical protein